MIAIIIIIGLLVISGAFYLGMKVGGYHSMRLVDTVTEENNRLKIFANAWSSAASSTTKISQEATQLHTQNIATTMETIVHLLGSVQQQQANNLSSQEQEKIGELINKARSIASP